MVDTSTKDTLANTKVMPAGKSASKNMLLGTNATIPIPTLQESAESLVALEIDLKEMQAMGFRWHAFPYLPKGGKLGLVVTLYHPDYNLGVEDLSDELAENLVALIEGERASVVATRKEGKK